MKLKIISAAMAIAIMLSLTACGKTQTAASENEAGSTASSEVSEPKNPWYDEAAYYERLEASGLPYKLNEDGTKPAEWTPEYYEGEEYAECDGITAGPEGYLLTAYSVYDKDYTASGERISWEALGPYDNYPEEMLWAMSTADFKRAAPGVEPPTDEDFKRFKEEAQEYLESRGASKYPIRFLSYHVETPAPGESLNSIRVNFEFVNEQNSVSQDIGTFHCLYSVKDYANQGYRLFHEGIDTAYGEGTYASLHEELVGDLVDDARSRTQAAS